MEPPPPPLPVPRQIQGSREEPCNYPQHPSKLLLHQSLHPAAAHRRHQGGMVPCRLIAIGEGELRHGLIEGIALAKVAADRGAVAGFGVGPGQRPAAELGVAGRPRSLRSAPTFSCRATGARRSRGRHARAPNPGRCRWTTASSAGPSPPAGPAVRGTPLRPGAELGLGWSARAALLRVVHGLTAHCRHSFTTAGGQNRRRFDRGKGAARSGPLAPHSRGEPNLINPEGAGP